MEENERQELINKFETTLTELNIDGMDRLLDFIRKSDFYTAPASTRFHGAYEGGLLQHSMNVFDCLTKKLSTGIWMILEKQYSDRNIAVSALLHDICKTYFYTTELRNQKTYDEEKVSKAEKWQIKSDSNGHYIWETVQAYKVDDKIPYGHGEKSVMMLEEYIKLEPCERYAIRWHMGAYDCTPQNFNTLGAAMEKYPLVLALHEADMEATHLMEVE